MAAVARHGPRLVVDAAPHPHVRFRVWEADALPSAVYPPSAHAGVEIAWIDDGEIGYAIGRARHDVRAGGAMLVPSEVEHVTHFPTAMRGAALWIDPAIVAEIADAMGAGQGPVAVAIPEGGRIARLGATLADEMRERDRGALLAVDAIVEAMVVGALRAAPAVANGDGPRTPRDPAIAAAVRLLEAAYAEPLGVDAMARASGMSRFHFSRRFREETGKSPYRYLVDLRLERAAELLRRGRGSVTEAAFDVGFSDPSRFARMFRARFGKGPKAYAALHRARATTITALAR